MKNVGVILIANFSGKLLKIRKRKELKMREEYKKEEKVIEQTEQEKDMEIMKSLMKTKRELETANKNFEYAEEELIDYYTYQIKANQSKLDYLVKKAKDQKLVRNMLEAIEMEQGNAS